ncbi:Pyridoxal phosphate (active vitamin B6) biosynthesis, pyridoxal kinase [Parasponia andersonii]|uniref:pyridoxal kinase n=1 Tax=Parasponia andersonii TaxID=3476 RepID=A0A2P5DVX7_PARAD|nr:Pyridoxal phosphate (active vitamin B6) biosynthesis, pyridoxal kinase [Parasponia andersonii]
MQRLYEFILTHQSPRHSRIRDSSKGTAVISRSNIYNTTHKQTRTSMWHHTQPISGLLRQPLRNLRFGIFLESHVFRARSSGMAPPILSLALPSETGRVLSIQSHTVQLEEQSIRMDLGGVIWNVVHKIRVLESMHSGVQFMDALVQIQSGVSVAIFFCPLLREFHWGYVGNKSAVFPLQLLGYDVDPINSVQFSNHTGYPTFKGQVLNGKQLWEIIEGLEENNLLYYTHLLTGYIGSVSFLNTVLEVVNKLRSINPKLMYVCDPVMGDEGKLYVPPELVSVYREKVVPVASMLTPNQFEAERLTGSRIESESDGREACNILHAAGPSKKGQGFVDEICALEAGMILRLYLMESRVVITSINIDGNLLLIGSHQKEKGQLPEQFKIMIPKIPAYFTGTGDLTTALLLGWSNKYPDNLEKAAELAVSSLQAWNASEFFSSNYGHGLIDSEEQTALLQRTLNDYRKAGHDPQSSSLELRLIQSQDDIRNPQVNFKAERYN